MVNIYYHVANKTVLMNTKGVIEHRHEGRISVCSLHFSFGRSLTFSTVCCLLKMKMKSEWPCGSIALLSRTSTRCQSCNLTWRICSFTMESGEKESFQYFKWHMFMRKHSEWRMHSAHRLMAITNYYSCMPYHTNLTSLWFVSMWTRDRIYLSHCASHACFSGQNTSRVDSMHGSFHSVPHDGPQIVTFLPQICYLHVGLWL